MSVHQLSRKLLTLGFFSWVILMLGECAVMVQVSLHQYQKVAQERAGEDSGDGSARFRLVQKKKKKSMKK